MKGENEKKQKTKNKKKVQFPFKNENQMFLSNQRLTHLLKSPFALFSKYRLKK